VREMRPQRKLTRTHTEIDTLEVEDQCCFVDCGKAATVDAFYCGEPRRICERHFRLLTSGEAIPNEWRFY
jgi:hypothetical protein